MRAGFAATDMISEIWAITGWIFYAGYLTVILAVARVPLDRVIAAGGKSIPSLIFGIVAAIATIYLFDLVNLKT